MSVYLNQSRIEVLEYEIGQGNLPLLLNIFLGELNEYQEVISAPDPEIEAELGSISHALKSSAASFGADTLCLMATELDAQVKKGALINTAENRQAMLRCLEKTILAYQSLF